MILQPSADKLLCKLRKIPVKSHHTGLSHRPFIYFRRSKRLDDFGQKQINSFCCASFSSSCIKTGDSRMMIPDKLNDLVRLVRTYNGSLARLELNDALQDVLNIFCEKSSTHNTRM